MSMSFSGRILLLPVIGAALLIVGCGDHHNTSLTNAQLAEIDQELQKNTFHNLEDAFGVGAEPSAGLAVGKPAAAVVVPDCTSSGGPTENCTLPPTSGLPCPSSGTFAIGGTFTRDSGGSSGVTTLNLTNISLIPTDCTTDDNVLISGDPGLTIKGTNIHIDDSTGNIELPFTITENGHVSFKPGTADPAFPTGDCDVDLTVTFEQVPGTVPPPLQVEAAVSGTLCGVTIPAGTIVPIGSF